MGIRRNYKDDKIEWWSADEAALFAGVSVRTVHGWAHKKWVRTRRATRQRILREDVEKLLRGD